MTRGPGDERPRRPWPVQTFEPFPAAGLYFARTAARSPEFSASDAAHGAPVLIGSAAGTRRESVATRALGELAERVGNVLAGRQAEAGRRAAVLGAYDALRRGGAPVVDPLAWPELRGDDGGLRGAELLWVPGESLTTGREVLVPAYAVYLAHRPSSGGAAPLCPGSTGLAAHRTRREAERHAAFEVLERHLLWRSWYTDGPRAVPPPGAGPVLPPPVRDALAALGVLATFVVLPGPAGTGCVVACLHAPDGSAQSFGARATHLPGPDGETVPGAAAESACCEALMVRWSLGTAAARTAWQRLRASGGDLPYGPLEHALHAYHRQDSLAHLLTGSTALPSGPPRAPRRPERSGGERPHPAGVLADLTGNDVVLVDTTADTGGPGLGEAMTVVRVVAPGARRLPADERAQRPPAGARTRLPHPLG
ncbi:YcaO-like family protein [Kitasatospora sp. NPDC056783]|uniref:YcaO-like family protein n=1 Tax=Kitasatospora sp. NPDC056783 TaxID=3345943 RepID=UPI0036A536BD